MILTTRQIQIARLITAAMPDKAIAATLGVSEHSVKSQIKAIYARLAIPVNVNRRVYLALRAHHL